MRTDSSNRRNQMLKDLTRAHAPISASALGKKYGVTRQVIVKDIAILRAEGASIVSTNRGYILGTMSAKPERVFSVRHEPDEIQAELSTIIERGGYVKDVEIDHPVYGVISAKIEVGSSETLRRFLEEFAPGHSLARLTGGYHRHTVSADSEETLDEIEQGLREIGFLVER